MDSHRIRLSALGRDVQVGNLYNYYADTITTSNVGVPQEYVSVDKKSLSQTEWFYLPQLDHLKYDALGINAHLRNSIANDSVDLSQLWFADSLKSNQSAAKEDNKVANASFFFRVVRRIETLHPHFLDYNLKEYQLESGGRATHLVEQVVYGAEFICLLKKTFDHELKEKEHAEEILYLAAKEYFSQIFFSHSANPNFPTTLNNVQCVILSSLEANNQVRGSCLASFRHLRETLSFDKDDRVEKWKPIQITLRNIPGQIEALLQSERNSDMKFARERHEITWKLIQSNCQNIMNNPSLNYVPIFKKMMGQFHGLLTLLWEKIKKFYEIFETFTPEQVVKEKEISNLLREMIDWVTHRRSEIRKILWLIKGTQLVVTDWEEINTSNSPNRTNLFVMQAECKQNSVVESIQQFIGIATAPVIPLLVLPILSYNKKKLDKIKEEFLTIDGETQTNYRDHNQLWICYHIGTTSEYSPLTNGFMITTIGNYKTMLAGPCLYFSMEKQRDDDTGNEQEFQFQPTAEDNQLLYSDMNTRSNRDGYQSSAEQRDNSIQVNKNTAAFLASPESYPHKRNFRQRQSKSPLKMDQENELNQPEEDRRVQEDTRSETLVDRDRNHRCVNKESADVVGNSPDVRYRKLSSTSTYRHDFCTSTASTENDQLNNQRIAEFFADEKKQYAKLIKQCQPNVYLLNAKETSVSGDLRWFDIGQLNGSSPFGFRNHKVIILMGATGCGKSTLINGMINYILGVRWNDPFRFKCVREDETTARNQAHSQTSSVTAYTLRHHKGMAVPYSITIIDTPGYGDTRGVQRDKEITNNIHQFLSQQETRVDELHAACFVAASGDSRLTTTQRYIIDSTLSIFGKDIKENIRLLVTFADNADPPVVDACRAANFPVTSASAGISYSKFNSSVLYANNEQQEDDGSCFDELFWDMGQENFSKFFTMLEGMNGRSLKSTREVIQSRHLLEQSLEHIEQELEVCLFNIENMEKFQRKMKQCGQKMEASKNFVIENMILSYNRFPCKKEFYAYNCKKCGKTCEQPIHSANPEKLPKKKCYNIGCPHQASDHDYEDVEIRPTTKIIKNTLLDLKEKYQSNADEKVANEQLLAGCSDQLNIAKAKVFSLLDQVGENVRSLESTALRSNTLSPSDYLCLMKSRVAEKQAPGYLIRLETLSELQKSLEDSAVAKTQQATACYHSNRQTFQHEFQSTGGSRGHGSNNAGGNQWIIQNGMEDYSIDFTRRNPTHGSKHNHFNNKPHWRN